MSFPSRIRLHQKEDGTSVRQGKLLSSMSTEWEGLVEMIDAYVPAAQFLAVKHLQEKSGAVLPHLPALLEGCDFEMSFQLIETFFSPVETVRALVEAATEPKVAGTTIGTIEEGGTWHIG
jgi:hypothetical protein